eukprot:GILK01006366.1.p1 GENE.GILK01006366.1~~GILK01006366.1.p1  ORF type:complete len:1345 (-),score=228.97 GILK01006366.1:167-4201(-)
MASLSQIVPGIDKFVDKVVASPEVFFQAVPTIKDQAVEITKQLYDFAKQHEPKPMGPLSQLLVHGFDDEQIWEELQLQNEPMLKYLDRQVKKLLKKPEKVQLFEKDPEEMMEAAKKRKRSAEAEEGDEEEEDDEEDVVFGANNGRADESESDGAMDDTLDEDQWRKLKRATDRDDEEEEDGDDMNGAEEEEEEEELDVYEVDNLDITSLSSSPELFRTQRKMPAGQISIQSGKKSHLPSSLQLASRPPLPARRASSDAPMPVAVKEEQHPHVRSGSIVFDPYRASQETKARAEFVVVDVRQPRRSSQPAVNKDDSAKKRRVSWSESLLPGQAQSPKSQTVPVQRTTFSAEDDVSSASRKQAPKRSQSGTLPYKKSRTKEFSDVGADSRILELTSAAPLLTLPFSEVFAISFWGTHRLFSLFCRPYKGHNSASRVVLFVSVLYFQLAAIGALYNHWELSYDTQCTFIDCLPRIKLQDLFLAATVTAMCIPLSVFLLLLLASEQQVGFVGQRQLADNLRGSLYESNRKKFSKFCLVGYLGCVVCLSLSLAFIGDVKIAQFTLTVPINHMWLAMWLVTFVMDIFVGELLRIFSHAFFLSWLTKPGGGDPWVKLRVVKFWFAYIVLAFILYVLFIVIGDASDRLQVWLESYTSAGAVVVFFLVANFSSLMLLGFILLFRPRIWSEHPKEWDDFKQLSLQHIREVALLITCHLSADILQQTLEAALHVFTPSQIFVCDNGRWTNPLDLWECCEADCAMGVEGSRFFKDTKQLDNHAQQHPSHPVRGFPQGKTAWICAKVSENYNRGDYDAYLTRPTPQKAEFINYLYIPEGSKIVALWYASRHYVSLNAKLNYIMQMDDDVILPSNYLLPFDSFMADPKVMSVVLPLHAVNMKQEDPTKPAWFVSWQELEYRSVGYIKYCTSRMGSALFCHGAASFWRKSAFDEVLNRHDTMHNGDDVQMGLNLHGLRGVLTIPGIDATKGFKIDTAWHAAIGTQVPLCWAHQSDFKQLLQRCLLGITAGFGESLLQGLFRRWKSVPCSCGEPSLFFQRGMGWDTTEHRFVGKYFLLFWTCMKTFNRRNVILALTAMSQIYITVVDATRLLLLPLALMYETPYVVLAAFGSAWGSSVISMFLFNVFILRKRGHIPPPYSAIWLFPVYKFVCVFWFRTCATIYNLLWYLPFNQNKHQIQTRMFSCDCQENGCAQCRYRPPFFYYSQHGHMPPGPRDMKEKWPAHPLAQWHVLDRSILRSLFSQLVDSAYNRAAKRFQTAKTKLKLSNHLKSNANRFKNMAAVAVKAVKDGGGGNDEEPEREPKHLLAFAKKVEPKLTASKQSSTSSYLCYSATDIEMKTD